MASLEDIVSLDRLPPTPSTLARIVPLILDPESEIGAIERAVRQDQAMTAAVLRLANSAAYGAPGREFDLKQSISRLGRENLRRCVFEQQVCALAIHENRAFGLHQGAMWTGALAGAIAAEALAKQHLPSEAGLAFLCGLLRDIGKLALDVRYGADYWGLLSRHARAGLSFCEVERAAMGFDHARVGSVLARRWNLPERLARAIELHHEPPESGANVDRVIDLVHAGDVVARWAGAGVGIDGLEYRLAEHVRRRFALDRPSVEGLMSSVWERVKQEESFLGTGTSQGVAA